MAECKDCIHYDMCKYRPLAIGVDICDVFRNTADVVPKSEVEKIFEEIDTIIETSEYELLEDFGDAIAKCNNAQTIIDELTTLKKKYI